MKKSKKMGHIPSAILTNHLESAEKSKILVLTNLSMTVIPNQGTVKSHRTSFGTS